MHRALGVLDILLNILEGEENSRWRPHVLVCKQWSQICLDAIWEDIKPQHVLHVFKLLGPIRKNNLKANVVDWTRLPGVLCFNFVAEPTAESWERFNYYRGRVKRFFLNSPEHYTDILNHFRPHAPIFPYLRSLGYHLHDTSFLREYGPLFITPTVKCLTILRRPEHSLSPPPPAHCENLSFFLQALNQSATELEEILINENWLDEKRDAFLAVLLGFRKLRSLNVSASLIQPHTILHNSSHFPDLVKIVNRFPGRPSAGEEIPSTHVIPGPPFDNLTSLVLHTRFSALVMQPRWFESHKITELDIMSDTSEDPQHVERLFYLIGNTCPELSRLSVRSWQAVVLHANQITVAFDTIRPLLRHCRQVTSFEFRHSYPVSPLNLSSLDEIISGWPKLEQLTVHSPNANQLFNDELPSFMDLIALLTGLPQLEGISITFQPPEGRLVRPPHPFNQLVRLGVNRTLPGDMTEMTAFLAHLCTNRTKIEHSWVGHETTGHSGWWHSTIIGTHYSIADLNSTVAA